MTQLVVQLPVADKNLLKDAADADGFRNLSDFVRSVTLEKAQAILGRHPVHPAQALPRPGFERQNTVYAYLGNAPPAHGLRPAIAFPSIRSFATAFSDRRRALLRYLAHNRPESIQALAHTLGQPSESVTRTLALLAGYGVVVYEHGAGKQLIPVLTCDRVKLILPLASDNSSGSAEIRCAVRTENDEPVPDGKVRLYTSIDEFAAALPPTAYRALLLIGEHRPESVRNLAQNLGVKPDRIYKVLDKLERLRLINTVGGYGKKPVLACDSLSLELVFRETLSA